MSKKVSVRLPDEMLAEVDYAAKEAGVDRSQIIVSAIRFAIDDAKRRIMVTIQGLPLPTGPTPAAGEPPPVEILLGAQAKTDVCAKGDPTSDVTIDPSHTEETKNFANFPEPGKSTTVEQAEAWEELTTIPNVAEEGTLDLTRLSHADAQKEEGAKGLATILNKCPRCGARLIPWGPQKRCRTCEVNW
jgi:Ribbon-helix-helix protein, copG family